MSNMTCPNCGHLKNECKDSRPTRAGQAVRRRRRCLSCKALWTTFEYSSEELRGVRSIAVETRAARALLPKLMTALDRIERLTSDLEGAELGEPA